MNTRKNLIKNHKTSIKTRKQIHTNDKPSYSIIITSSSVISHPSIELIKCTIESLKHAHMNENTPIILAHDGSDDLNYKEYLKRLRKYISDKPNIKIVIKKINGGLSENIRNALKYINTKYILIVQHDFPFIRDFEIEKIIEDMETNLELKYVRFNKRANIKFRSNALNNLFGKEVRSHNYTYTRTPSWSDNNHLCRTDYYRNIVMKGCKRNCMEGRLTLKQKTMKDHKKYGTYLFGKRKESAYIYHTNGRSMKRVCCPDLRKDCYSTSKKGLLLDKDGNIT
jgi:glycosyltransferase involved in cell wall biosynthesis